MFTQDAINFKVNKSSSFLLLAFDRIQKVKSVRFEWQLESGELAAGDAARETTRDGDDAVFKLGLMIESAPQLPAPFVAEWLRQVNAALNFASDRVIYIVANARHSAGEIWPSPYNKRVRMIAAQSRELDTGWTEAAHVFDQTVNVVGLWLMADGDNTDSTFSGRIKNIRLEQ